jgi:hypothetical protein
MHFWPLLHTLSLVANLLHFYCHFDSFGGTHTGVRIAEKIENTLSKFNISSKIAGITTENASNMKKALEVLSDLFVKSTAGAGGGITGMEPSDIGT